MSAFQYFRIAASVATLFLCVFSIAPAQPQLTLHRVVTPWPVVEVEFSVQCDGSPVINLTRNDIRLRENGLDILDFSVHCPFSGREPAISVVVTCQVTSNMAEGDPSPLELSKDGLHEFVDSMDGRIDEAGLIMFNSRITLYQQMTTNVPMLRSAVDVLYASGGFPLVRDAAFAGLIEVINNGINMARGIIVLADSRDNSSSRSSAEVTALAKRHRIKIYTVYFGGYGDEAPELREMSTETGGRYFLVRDAAAISDAMVDIMDHLRTSAMNCFLRYESECPDASERTLEVELVDVCGGSDIRTMDFRVPLDSSYFSIIEIELASVSAKPDSEIRIPVRFVAPPAGRELHSFGFTLQYPTERLALLRAEGAPGSLYEGAVFRSAMVAGGATVECDERRIATASDYMFDLVFLTSSDSGCVNVRGVDGYFSGGCAIPDILTARICMFSELPDIACAVDGLPRLRWNNSKAAYEPEQFPVIARISNNGAAAARLSHVRINYRPDELTLIAPASDTLFYSSTVIGAGQTMDVIWDVAPMLRSDNAVSRVCVTAAFDNHHDVTCCSQTTIPHAEPQLACSFSTETVLSDTVRQRHLPMPFEVTLDISNDGVWVAENVRATLEFSGELSLAASLPSNVSTKYVFPRNIDIDGARRITWLLTHPLTREDRNYTLRAFTVADNSADTGFCTINVLIPGVPELLPARLNVIGTTNFCEGDSVVLDAGEGFVAYRWNNGHTERMLTMKRAGMFFCIVTDATGSIGVTDTVYLRVHSLPDPTSVRRDRNTLVCLYDAASYQWYKDGEELPGETDRSLQLTETGVYSVYITSVLGCSIMSHPFHVTTLSVGTPSRVRSFDVWPEPNYGVIRVSLRSDEAVESSIIVRTVLGQEIARYHSGGKTMEYIESIDLGDAPAGVYFLHVRSGAGNWVRSVLRAAR